MHRSDRAECACRTSVIPEVFGTFARYIGAAQADIAQHAIVELLEQAAASRPLAPLAQMLQHPCHLPSPGRQRRGGRSRVDWPLPACIDTISRHGYRLLAHRTRIRIKLTSSWSQS